MALSGTTNSGSVTYNGYTYYTSFTWSATQSIANNQSTVSWSWKVHCAKAGYFYMWGDTYATVNGTTNRVVAKDSSYYINFNGATSYTLKSGSFTITHNSSGAGSFTVSSTAHPCADNLNCNISQTYTLDTIPRASEVTARSAASITISNSTGTGNIWGIGATPKSSSFYNKMTFYIDDVQIATFNKGQQSAYFDQFVTTTQVVSQMGSKSSATIKGVCYTYSNSGYTSLIGQSQMTATVTITATPSITVSLNKTTVAPTKDGTSTVTVTPSITNRFNASTSSVTYTVSNNNASVASSSASSATINVPAKNDTYTLTVTAKVKDTRSKEASVTSSIITVYGYSNPTITADAYRCDADGTRNSVGEYAKITASATSNYKNGTLTETVTIAYDGSSSTTSGTVIALAIDATRTYTVTANDTYGTSTVRLTVGTAIFPLDLYDDGEGNVGVGLNTSAEPNSVNIGTQMKFTKYVTYDNTTYHGYEKFTISDGTVKEPYLGIGIKHGDAADGRINIYRDRVAIPSGINLNVAGIVTGSGVFSLNSVGNSGWSTEANRTKIPNMAFMAYWNGRYSDSGSNLQYCDRGRFGTIVTKSTGDYLPIGGGNATGEIKVSNYPLLNYNNLSTSSHTIIAASTTIAAGSYKSGTTNITKSGYYPILISGWQGEGSGSANLSVYRCYLSAKAIGSGTIAWGVGNTGGSQWANDGAFTVYVLWIKAS